MMRPPLRVALLMDSRVLPAWTRVMIQKIMGSDYAEVCLVVLDDTPAPVLPVIESLKTKCRYFLQYLYVKLDAALFRQSPDAFEPGNTDALLKGVPVLKVKALHGTHADRFQDEDIRAIREYKLDVIIRLGFGILRGGILEAAKYGVWSFHHGDNTVNRGGPAGFWEVLEKHPVTGSILQILSEDLDNGRVLGRSYSATDRVSLHRSRNTYFWKTLELLPRKLRELHAAGEEAFFARADELNLSPSFYSQRLYSPSQATNWRMCGLLCRHLLSYIREKLNFYLYHEHWFLLFHISPALSTSLWKFSKIVPPADRFWADPHVVRKDGKYYIFIEEFLYRTKKGHIALMVMDEKGGYAAPVPVLERPYHLSYPFVFEHQGAYYMIPESMQNRTIELYRCTSFPGKWEFVKNIMSGVEAVDTTLFRFRDTWWLFTNIVTNKGASSYDELFLFSADDLLSGSWAPHPWNPIISDVRQARSAGKIFLMNGKLYRPSQDCSQGYGTAIRINEITALDRNEYREAMHCTVTPSWDSSIKGLHTFAYEDGLTMFDGKMNKSKQVSCH